MGLDSHKNSPIFYFARGFDKVSIMWYAQYMMYESDKKTDRNRRMTSLREKGFSYGAIGKVFNISRQRVHQLLSGYVKLQTGNNKFVGWYKKIHQSVLWRDNHTCQKCGRRGELVHHLDSNDTHNNPTNLITLCRKCHLGLHRPKGLRG